MNIADRRVEETRPHISRSFYYCGDPRGIAAWGDILFLCKMSAKVLNDPAQFLGIFNDEPRREICCVLTDKLFDLRFQRVNFLGG